MIVDNYLAIVVGVVFSQKQLKENSGFTFEEHGYKNIETCCGVEYFPEDKFCKHCGKELQNYTIIQEGYSFGDFEEVCRMYFDKENTPLIFESIDSSGYYDLNYWVGYILSNYDLKHNNTKVETFDLIQVQKSIKSVEQELLEIAKNKKEFKFLQDLKVDYHLIFESY